VASGQWSVVSGLWSVVVIDVGGQLLQVEYHWFRWTTRRHL